VNSDDWTSKLNCSEKQHSEEEKKSRRGFNKDPKTAKFIEKEKISSYYNNTASQNLSGHEGRDHEHSEHSEHSMQTSSASNPSSLHEDSNHCHPETTVRTLDQWPTYRYIVILRTSDLPQEMGLTVRTSIRHLYFCHHASKWCMMNVTFYSKRSIVPSYMFSFSQ